MLTKGHENALYRAAAAVYVYNAFKETKMACSMVDDILLIRTDTQKKGEGGGIFAAVSRTS